ncbi:DUF389 domain-containing protein [Salinimicrobium sp. GXAS 041]|uniref:DUF389 domain-containing protein n=1 Tax=Salinimicrobium sp. GXAS 041 TaxID=3400806 RepID=UPI003C75179B
MLYILHQSKYHEEVQNKVIPLLKDSNYNPVAFSELSEVAPEKDDVVLTFLSDEDMRTFLPMAAKNDWCVGILPHPELIFTSKGLGIAESLEKAVEDILHSEEKEKLDLLYCNGIPVLQSVNIGNVFILTERRKSKNFFSQVVSFFSNIRKVSGLSHRSFTLEIDGEKLIQTSALGLIVVEHPSNSVVAKTLIPESPLNDGMFYVLILSPQNLLQLIWFLLKSLVPSNQKVRQLPSFIGSIKTNNLKITHPSEVEFTVDGQKITCTTINLQLQAEAISLSQPSIYHSKEESNGEKKSIKIDRLPTGEKRVELARRTLPFLPRATTEEFQDLFKILRENSKATAPFTVMMILSTLIATFGLFANSSPVIIGAMILAPIISPIVAFSMGMVRYDVNLLKKGIITILIGTVVSLLISAGVSLIIPLKVITEEMNDRLSPTLLDMGIAIASGIAAAYAHAKEGIAKSLAGVAIAVALVPPLAVAGVGLGWTDWEVFSGAILLYLTNLSGIIMFAGITFLVLGFAPFKRARAGLVYTFIIIALVMIPLSLSFNRINEEAKITRQLEGANIEGVILRDVKVRYGSSFMVSVKLVGPTIMGSEQMEEIKEKIEERIGHTITLEVISALEF